MEMILDLAQLGILLYFAYRLRAKSAPPVPPELRSIVRGALEERMNHRPPRSQRIAEIVARRRAERETKS